jgi:methylated-DNA-[protein]-cysteine S-methyltransferase
LSQGLVYTIFRTEAGWTGVLRGDIGLKRVTLPQKSKNDAYSKLGDLENTSFSEKCFGDLQNRLRSYFSGKKVDFSDKLDFSGATDFQIGVWKATMNIPYGQTRSYAWVAARMGRPKAFRAVGQALGLNPFPVIVPCHRVIAGDGSLHGFTGGLEMKKQMIALERTQERKLQT